MSCAVFIRTLIRDRRAKESPEENLFDFERGRACRFFVESPEESRWFRLDTVFHRIEIFLCGGFEFGRRKLEPGFSVKQSVVAPRVVSGDFPYAVLIIVLVEAGRGVNKKKYLIIF